MKRKTLSHTDAGGKARMVDVGKKANEERLARAEGFIRLLPETIHLIKENEIKKGDVLMTAEIAGIQAAKQTSTLIPLCHPLLLTGIKVKASSQQEGIRVESMVECTGRTGVEMEALTAVNIALLTIYDMCKAVDDRMEIGKIKLLEKTKKPVHGKKH